MVDTHISLGFVQWICGMVKWLTPIRLTDLCMEYVIWWNGRYPSATRICARNIWYDEMVDTPLLHRFIKEICDIMKWMTTIWHTNLRKKYYVVWWNGWRPFVAQICVKIMWYDEMIDTHFPHIFLQGICGMMKWLTPICCTGWWKDNVVWWNGWHPFVAHIFAKIMWYDEMVDTHLPHIFLKGICGMMKCLTPICHTYFCKEYVIWWNVWHPFLAQICAKIM